MTLGAGTSAVARWRTLEASMRVASSSSWGWILICILVGRRWSGAVVSSTKAPPSRSGLHPGEHTLQSLGQRTQTDACSSFAQAVMPHQNLT